MRRYGYIPLHSVTSDAAPALSPESTLFIEYCTGGPSSTTPVLLSCVDSFDTAPPPQDLLAGYHEPALRLAITTRARSRGEAEETTRLRKE